MVSNILRDTCMPPPLPLTMQSQWIFLFSNTFYLTTVHGAINTKKNNNNNMRATQILHLG